MHVEIAQLVRTITAYDRCEQEHIQASLNWIESGAPLFRTAKPATPLQHLVAYFVVVDPAQQQLLLVDHIKADLWLPSGGHVEPAEHPQQTVCREIREELNIEAEFLLPDPLFLTVTQTVGSTAGHTDVSLWYVVAGVAGQTLLFDAAEFRAVRWFAFDHIPVERSDPHMGRFTAKLRQHLL